MSASSLGIRKKLALLTSLALLPLFLLAAAWLLHLDSAQRAASLERARRASLAAAEHNLQEAVARARSDLELLADRPWVRRLLARGGGRGADGEAAGLVDKFLAGSPDRLAFWLADAGGTVIFRAGQSGAEVASRAGERQCLAATRARPAGSLYVSPVILEPSALGGPPRLRLCVAMSLPGEQGRQAGVAALDLEAARLLAGAWPPMEGGEGTRRLVLDQSGRVLFAGWQGGPVAGTACSRLWGAACGELLQGGVLTMEMEDRAWQASARQVGLWPGRPPGLVLSEMTPSLGWADALMRPLAWELIAGALAISLVAGILVWAAGGGLAANLGELAQSMIRFGGGDRLARARENGPTEAVRLAGAFNQMAESLAARQQDLSRELEAREQELTQAGYVEERGRALLEGLLGLVPEAVLVLDPEGRIRALNQAAAELFGQGAADLLGREAAGLPLLAGERGSIGERLGELRRAGGQTSFALRVGQGAGERMRLAARAVGQEQPAPLVLMLGGPDGAGDEAPLERQICRALFSGLPEACTLVFDRELRYTLAEGGLLGRMGFSREEVMGRTLSEVFDPGTVWIVRALYQATLAGEEAVFDMPYGQGMHEVRLTPIRDARGRVTHGLALMRELLADGEAAATHEQAAEVSDEAVRAPLEGIIGLAQALERGACGGLNAQQLRCARQIVKSGRRLQSLLNHRGKEIS